MPVAPGTRRLTRPALYLTTAQALQELDDLSFLERACAHILAGWIVKTPLLDVKVEWGRQLQKDMEYATRLRERAKALRAGENVEACSPARWRDRLKAIDGSIETSEVLRGLYGVKQTLFRLYEQYLASADPLADSFSFEIVQSALSSSKHQLLWMKKQVGEREAGKGKMLPLERRGRGELVSVDEASWPPLDRVPRVARPPKMRRGEPGALRIVPIRPRSRRDTGLFLHNFLNEEFATLELIARNSYEHPEMPWAFHLDAARHASDEARHAKMFIRAMKNYDVRYGDYPIYTYSYEGEYEFPGTEAEPGSSRELLWRILLRQVVHEGLALDSTPFEIRKREYLKQPEVARIFGYILADEVFHAGSGIKWSRYLVGGDEREFEQQRERAFSYYSERLKDRRLTWGASHIKEAVEEEKQLEELARRHKFPFEIELNVAARKRAGYSEQDLARLARERKG